MNKVHIIFLIQHTNLYYNNYLACLSKMIFGNICTISKKLLVGTNVLSGDLIDFSKNGSNKWFIIVLIL